MKKIFKKWVLWLYFISIFFTLIPIINTLKFIPLNIAMSLNEFIYSALILLTLISLFIVITEWKSPEPTLPNIQILIGVAPFILIPIVFSKASDPHYLYILFPLYAVILFLLPIIAAFNIIFIISGTKGIISKKKIK